MEELIKITQSNGTSAVSARELYAFLEVNSNFTTWSKRMFTYGFEQDVDYCLSKKGMPDNQSITKSEIGQNKEYSNPNPPIDYALTLDCAKEISMIQRNEKGKQARRYFIEVEKKAKQIAASSDDLFQAEILANHTTKIEELESKVKLLEQTSTCTRKPRNRYLTIRDYVCKLGKSLSKEDAYKAGIEASNICLQRNLKIRHKRHPYYGMVRKYPTKVLDEILTQTIYKKNFTQEDLDFYKHYSKFD